MIKIDETGLELCKLQGELFKVSKKTAVSSAVFIRRYMFSAVAERMDGGSFLFSSDNIESLIDEVNVNYKNASYGSEKFADEELYWIGYVYRYWAYCFEKSSKSVFKTIGAREMRSLYFPYHSLDPGQAIERIYEAKGEIINDDLTKGVEFFRSIVKNKSNDD